MASLFRGTLAGQGTQHLSDVGVTVTDIDYWVQVIGPRVDKHGVPGHALLKRAGYIQFTFHPSQNFDPTQPDEAVSEAVWFNYESADTDPLIQVGNTVTDFVYWISAGTSVQVNVAG